MTKWQYLVEPSSSKDGEKHLNERGAEGWELIDIRHNGMPPVWFTFKRPLDENNTYVDDDGYQWVSWTQKIQPLTVAPDDLIEWEYWKAGRFFKEGPLRADQVPWVQVNSYRVVSKHTPDTVSCF